MNYFDEYYLGAFRKFATFSGRARRKEYGWFCVFSFIVGLILGIIDVLVFGDADGMFSSIYGLVVFIPSLALLVRRVHDFGKSGWFVLVIIFAPTIALIVSLLFIQRSKELGMLFLVIALALFFYFIFLPIFKKGDEGENAYGSDPKALNL